jgi:hypothetical protein
MSNVQLQSQPVVNALLAPPAALLSFFAGATSRSTFSGRDSCQSRRPGGGGSEGWVNKGSAEPWEEEASGLAALAGKAEELCCTNTAQYSNDATPILNGTASILHGP